MTETKAPEQRILLDIGCGENKTKGWIGMDRRAVAGVDIVHDVEDIPWPLEDDSCSMIMCSHLWEHLKPWLTIDIADEMWRVLEPEGQVVITLPYGYSQGFLQDPTHINSVNETTWEYFDPSFELYGVYKPKPWRIVKRETQMFGNMLIAMNTRKDRDAKPFIHPELLAVPPGPDTDKVLHAFHVIQYECRTFENHPRWMGLQIDKSPYDLWRYQELIFRVKPKLIVETGTANGSSALYFAHLLDLLIAGGLSDDGRVVTIDLDDGTAGFQQNPSRTNPGKRPFHPRIDFVRGHSLNINIAKQVGEMAVKAGGPVIVILDSDHTQGHVKHELDIYHPIVTDGSYLVVEDTNVNGHPVFPEYGPGPTEALLEWLPLHPDFENDWDVEKRFPITHNPGGWLRRKGG